MKVIILAGGLGTRIAEETADKPKPMVLINGQPIIWHIMNIYARQGFEDFMIATGYKGKVISDWVTSLKTNWRITTIDTGLKTQTGGRIKKCMNLCNNERVLATYGDGVGNIDLRKLLRFHEIHGRLATLSAVRPPARFGHLKMFDGQVKHFGEKNQSDVGWINGGFFVLEPQVLSFIKSSSEPFETGALPRLAEANELMGFEHDGFWQPIDTLREKQELDRLASIGNPPWLIGI